MLDASGAASVPGPTGPAPVEVAFAGPAPQRRLTVAFRIILAIPHAVVLSILAFAAEVVVFVGWFAALFTGRLPDGMARFVTQVLQYGTRVNAYTGLLTDRYPSFDLGEADYPVAVEVRPGSLNRLAVLFRIFLAIPAGILMTLVRMGLAVAGFFIWLIVLITGRVPATLYQALASTLRYETRGYGYLALLTAEYPWGLFGDRTAPSAGPPAAPSWPPAPAPDPGVLPPDEPPLAASAPSGLPAPDWAPGVGPAPLATRLVLSGAARRTVGLFVALGVLVIAGYAALISVVVATGTSSLDASNSLDGAYSTLSDAVNRFETASAACRGQVDPLTCEETAVRGLAPAFSQFSHSVRSISFPGGVGSEADALVSDSDAMHSLLVRMGAAPTAAAYVALAGRFQSLGARFDADYRRLQQDLV